MLQPAEHQLHIYVKLSTLTKTYTLYKWWGGRLNLHHKLLQNWPVLWYISTLLQKGIPQSSHISLHVNALHTHAMIISSLHFIQYWQYAHTNCTVASQYSQRPHHSLVQVLVLMQPACLWPVDRQWRLSKLNSAPPALASTETFYS